MNTLKDLLGSKKAIMAIAGLLTGLAAKVGMDIDTEALVVVLSPIVAYILGQGLADQGKEKEIVVQAQREMERQSAMHTYATSSVKTMHD